MEKNVSKEEEIIIEIIEEENEVNDTLFSRCPASARCKDDTEE